jgi:uncharacterized protein YjiS (DUF1127 family)
MSIHHNDKTQGARMRRSLGFFGRQIMLGLQRWQRQKAIAQLRQLDDRQLADIGISRNDIPLVVDGMLASPHGRKTPAEPARGPRVEDDVPLREAA